MKVVALALFIVFSAESVAGPVLSWDMVKNLAAQENPTVVAAKQDWTSAQQTEKVAFAGFLPSLRGNISATRTGGNSPSGGGGALVSNGVVLNNTSGGSISTNYLASLVLNQNIFKGLSDSSKMKQAEWNTQNKFWAYIRSKSNVSYSLKEAYANLVFNQELSSLAQSILERRESNYKLVSIRFNGGRENKGSVLLSEAYREQARLDLIKAQDGLRVAQQALKALINRDGLDDFQVAGDPPLADISLPESEFEKHALQTPDYQQSLALEQAASADITIQRSAFLPSLDLQGLVSRQDDIFFPDRERERWSVALTLSVPIFDGLSTVGAFRTAVSNQTAADKRKRATYLNLIPLMKTGQTEAKQSEIKYTIDSKFKEAAETRAEISRRKYNNGLLTFEDWDIIESELIQRQQAFLQSKRERVLKHAAWERTLGTGVL